MREQFLESFSKTSTATQLVEAVLQPDLDIIKDVTTELGIEGTNGEILVGRKMAAKMIQQIIDDIETYKNKKRKVKDLKDQY